ncbi:ABC transporter substrate-binding protein [Thermodesulfatator autotrophicus]|uniref:ABC transporter substrate-binding protein n=1 Tax=Thermodesulfatator autotrophicus TaxID=1795632 RepID=UPI0018D3C945|nr:ABC transporter substrate-binding protein [Thermodesulfatator autotrophicus]
MSIVLWLWAGEAHALRIVVLYPGVSPILKALGIEKEVVGTTRHDHLFPQAIKVGSHLRPNLELVKVLRPDILIVGSRRAFPDELTKRFKAKVYRYDPHTLKEILKSIKELGSLLGKEKEAQKLVAKLSTKLKKVKSLPYKPKVIYEVTSLPLKVAGQKSVVTDIIRAAGGINPVKARRKHVLISPEKILALSPDFYLYQEGPMNRNPTPPEKRPYFKGLSAVVIKVPEFEFARPGLSSFEATIKLNRLFWKYYRPTK